MVSVLELLNRLKNLLESSEELENIKFTLNFNNTNLERPLTGPTVVLGIKSMNIKNGPFNGYVGTSDNTEYFGNESNIKIGLDIYVPRKIGSEESFNIFQKIYKILFMNEENIDVLALNAKEINYDSDVGAFLLECEALAFSFLIFKENS